MNALHHLTSAGYTITDADSTRYGEPTGYITDALTGTTMACFRNGERVQMGVALCPYCDDPLDEAWCWHCEEGVQTVEQRLSRTATVANVRARIAATGGVL